MSKIVSKYLRLIVLSLLATVIVCFTACGDAFMETIPFNLNTLSENFDPPRISYIRNSEEFKEFLSDDSIFVDEFDQEFTDVNSQYDHDFFEKNDLIALILQASSGMVKGYKLNNLSVIDNSWVVEISSISEKSNVTDDMGGYFCYYISVGKNPDVNDAKIK